MVSVTKDRPQHLRTELRHIVIIVRINRPCDKNGAQHFTRLRHIVYNTILKKIDLCDQGQTTSSDHNPTLIDKCVGF